MGPLARSLETFFTEHGLALPTDHAGQLAAGRRRRRVGAAPGPLRPAVDGFAFWMLAARERARRAGTRPGSDHTIEADLATMRDLALFLAGERGKQDWALADVHDIEAFLATLPRARKRRLTVLRQFFRFARTGRSPASTAYISHLLDGCGVPPRALRCTRLADLVNTLDPKLVAAAFGMKPESVMFYLAGHVDPSRLTEQLKRS
jgi:hypothetical protein